MALRSAWRRALLLPVAVVLILAASCGDDDDAAVDASPEATSDDDASPEATSDDDASPEATSDDAVAPTGEVTIGYVDTIDDINPFPQGAGSLQFRLALYDPLIAIDEAGSPVAKLAESWEFAEDGTSLTLDLRDGVTFHDGTPFDADVAVQNIELWKDPATNVQGNEVWAVVSAEAIDSSTVEMTFERPLPEIFGVMNTAMVTKPGELDSGIGTGAFVLDSFTPRESLVLTANPDYWDPDRPMVAEITLREFTDAAAASLAAQSGDIDVLLSVPATQIADLDGAGLTVLEEPGGVGFDILVNAELVPDARVRRALNLAFDRARFVDTLLLGYGTPMSSIYPPSSPVWADQDAEVEPLDLEAAQALLDEAGVTSLDLTIMSPTILALDQFMPIYQADLASIGINLEIEQVDPATWLDAVSQPGAIPDLAAHAYAFADLDPALIFSAHPFRIGSNASGYETEEYATLVAESSAVLDTDERFDAFRAVDRFIADESFMFPVANPTVLAALAADVSGLGVERAGFDYSTLTVSE